MKEIVKNTKIFTVYKSQIKIKLSGEEKYQK